MKLIACETVAAIVVHLRADDGEHKPSGGLRAKFLCGMHSTTGAAWDKPNLQIPDSPEAADALNKRLEHSRWCSGCVNAWRVLLVPEKAAADREERRKARMRRR